MLATDTLTWKNPVYPHYFADPFVLKFQGIYYAYGTAPPSADGNQFPVLRSQNMAHWEYLSHALVPINNPPGVNYWAPEVAHKDGVFYLYYSATTSASDEHHRLRVATSRAPEGPFTDSGNLLLPDSGFSIDAHPFCDPKTGKWYLFFAADFTDEEPYGTGLAVVSLSDDLTWAVDKPRVVVRASAPWQVYEHNRNYKGRLWQAWNCVEGPFVLFHDDRYYCFYSGGAWHTENYGLGFAVADHPLRPMERRLRQTRPLCPQRSRQRNHRPWSQLRCHRSRWPHAIRHLPRLGQSPHRPAHVHRPAEMDQPRLPRLCIGPTQHRATRSHL